MPAFLCLLFPHELSYACHVVSALRAECASVYLPR